MFEKRFIDARVMERSISSSRQSELAHANCIVSACRHGFRTVVSRAG
jgi:hypothetical protein